MRVRSQVFQRNEFQRGGVRGFKIDRGRAIVIKRAFPTRDADAPFVTGLESGKSPFRSRRYQIVSIEHGEIQKLARDFHAHRVQSDIFRSGATKSVAIESCHGIATTGSEFSPENVCGHQRKVANDSPFQSKSQAVIRRNFKMFGASNQSRRWIVLKRFATLLLRDRIQ